MTFATIKNDVQSFLGFTISATSRVTTTEIEQWINQSYRVAQSKMATANVNYYQGETTEADTTANVDTYTLPTGFLAMKRLEIQYNDNVDKVRAIPMDINDVWGTVSPDNEVWNQKRPYYYAWENTLIIKPTPDESSATWATDAGSAYKLWFIELQDDLTGTAVPALPATYHHILSYEATAKGFRRMKKFTEAREYEQLWQKGLSDMVAENTFKDKTKPLAFTITRGTSGVNGMVRP